MKPHRLVSAGLGLIFWVVLLWATGSQGAVDFWNQVRTSEYQPVTARVLGSEAQARLHMSGDRHGNVHTWLGWGFWRLAGSVSSVVLTGPLNPALVEFLTPKGQKTGSGMKRARRVRRVHEDCPAHSGEGGRPFLVTSDRFKSSSQTLRVPAKNAPADSNPRSHRQTGPIEPETARTR